MEITIRNTTPQMMAVTFENGDEYELPSESEVTLSCAAGSTVEFQQEKVVTFGIQSPLGLDESTDEEN